MEKYLIFLVLAAFVGASYLRHRMSRSRTSDLTAIERYINSNNLRVVEITQNGNHWRYWLRGNLLLSNVARIYLVTAESSDGALSTIHMAFDPIDNPTEPKILK
jgi:hypothetical protein